jgi:hypothetical protein
MSGNQYPYRLPRLRTNRDETIGVFPSSSTHTHDSRPDLSLDTAGQRRGLKHSGFHRLAPRPVGLSQRPGAATAGTGAQDPSATTQGGPNRLRPGLRGERATRIELAFSAWEADVLPLNYAREVLYLTAGAGTWRRDR